MRICTVEFAPVFCLWSPTAVSTTWPGCKPLHFKNICLPHIFSQMNVFFFMILKAVFVLRASLTASYDDSTKLQKRRRKLLFSVF